MNSAQNFVSLQMLQNVFAVVKVKAASLLLTYTLGQFSEGNQRAGRRAVYRVEVSKSCTVLVVVKA